MDKNSKVMTNHHNEIMVEKLKEGYEKRNPNAQEVAVVDILNIFGEWAEAEDEKNSRQKRILQVWAGALKNEIVKNREILIENNELLNEILKKLDNKKGGDAREA